MELRVLAPGNYTLSSPTRADPGGRSASTIRRALRTNPSTTSGDDYATTVLGNVGQSSGADIQLTGLDHLTSLSFSGGLMHAINTNNDPIVTLLTTNNSAD